MKAILALEDGTVFEGSSFGASGECHGEVVFNTSMSGYQEIITDPSYKGQIVTMTYPLIGNYGVNNDDVESCRPFVEGLVVREVSKLASNWRSRDSLDGYFKKNNIVGIEGIDTRALTLHIRQQGAMKAIITTQETEPARAIEIARNSPTLIGRDLVKEVICSKPYQWSNQGKYNLVAVDCGIKLNMLRILAGLNCKIAVVPATTSAAEILNFKPDGLLLSNGPGDPAALNYIVDNVRQLLGKVPIFGICLGHQIIGQALGGTTYKLKFGHHGANHPVKDLKTDKVLITVQNHGFCVDTATLSKKDIEITHMNLNDKTLEGMRHKKLPVFSVQFHPEASPGPHDALYLFDQFVGMMKNAKG